LSQKNSFRRPNRGREDDSTALLYGETGVLEEVGSFESCPARISKRMAASSTVFVNIPA
jgi:hypothetical protein